MPKNLNKIIQEIFVDKKINTLQETEKEITKTLGEKFVKKHIQGMFIKNKKIIIKTKTIEAKTELNIIKKNFNTAIKFL